MYKAINKELSAKNQELRISIRELRAEIIMIKAQKMEDREKMQLLKNSLKDILTKSYNDILNCLFTDEHNNVNSNASRQLDFLSNNSSESGNKSNEKSESNTSSSTSVSKRQSFRNCFAEDPLEIDPLPKNTNDCEKVTIYEDNQTALLKKKRRTLENSVSPSPIETLSVNEDLSSSLDSGQQTNSYNENIVETMINVSSKSDYEINMELHTISEEAIISVESFDNSRTKVGSFLETEKNKSVTLTKQMRADNTQNESNRFGSSFCNMPNNSPCELTNNHESTSTSNFYSMQNNDGEGLHPDNFTLFRGNTLSDSRIMGLIEAPCSTPFKSLPTNQTNQNSISSDSDCTLKKNDSTMKKVCVRLPRIDLNKLKNSNCSKSGRTKVKSDIIPIKKKKNLKKQTEKTINISSNKENYYSIESETSSISTRPTRSGASKKSLIEPSLKAKIRRN